MGSGMATYSSSTPNHTMGFSEEYLQSLRRLRAEVNVAHPLSHPRPGLRVLDFGCGPGAISAGAAKAAAPGELHGAGMEAPRIELVMSVAVAGGQDNGVFHAGDATASFFPYDTSDDTVFIHGLTGWTV